MTNSSYHTYHLQVADSQLLQTRTEPTAVWQFAGKILQTNWSTRAMHALVWLLIFLVPQLALLAATGIPAVPHLPYFISFACMVSLQYIHHYHWMPVFYHRKKFRAYGIMAAAGLACILLIQIAGTAISPRTTATNGLPPALTLLYLSATYISVWLLSMFIHTRTRLAELEARHQKTQTALLNSQIKPHFLFNSLNWIYLLALEQSADTADAVSQLSGMMRYITRETGADLIDLRYELDYIKNYVALQKGRLGHTVTICSCIPVYRGPGRIAPLLIMSFIENAFKHGTHPDGECAIHIDISITGNRLCMQVINNKIDTQRRSVPGTGMGISNARERLALLYPGMHQLEILDNPKIYAVKLSIQML